MAAHLTTPDNQIEYRFMVGLTVAAWVLLVIAMRELAIRLHGRLSHGQSVSTWMRRAGLAPLILVVVLASIEARQSIQRLMIEPSEVKEAYLRSELSGFDPLTHRDIVVVSPSSWPTVGRLGVFSTVTDLSHGWVLEPNLRLLLNEGGRLPADMEIHVIEQGAAPGTDGSSFLLELQPLVDDLTGRRP